MPPLPPAESVARIQANPDERSRVAAQRAKLNDQKLEKGAAGAALALTILARRAPNAAAKVLLGLSGVDLRKRGLNRFTKFAYGWLAPQPIGIVPPGFFGLSPGYLHDLIPGLPESEYLHTIGPDHPAMVKFQAKKNLRKTLEPIGPQISSAATAEAAVFLEEAELGKKLGAVQRWPGDFRHWISYQLTGPHHGILGHTVTGSGLVAETFEPLVPLPTPFEVPPAPAERTARKNATVEQLGAATSAAALGRPVPGVVRARLGRRADTVAPSRVFVQRKKADARKAIETANAPFARVGK